MRKEQKGGRCQCGAPPRAGFEALPGTTPQLVSFLGLSHVTDSIFEATLRRASFVSRSTFSRRRSALTKADKWYACGVCSRGHGTVSS